MIMLSEIRIKEMVRMQDTLNKTTAGGDWATQGLNFRLAAIMEAAEAIEGIGYKWWKRQEPDIENAKVELIDIVHFVISDLLQEYGEEELSNLMHKAQATQRKASDINKITLVEQFHLLINTLALHGHPQATLNLLWIIWGNLGMEGEDLYKAYMTKNLLNNFRQANGYKDGSYKKLWVHNNEEVEDNVVAFELAKSLSVDEDFSASMHSALKYKYKNK